MIKDKPSFEESFLHRRISPRPSKRSRDWQTRLSAPWSNPSSGQTEKYEEYVGGPIRRTMFKEDPRDTGSSASERQAVLEATGASEGKRRGDGETPRQEPGGKRAGWTRCQVLWANGCSPRRRRSLILGPIRAFGRVLFSRSKSGKDPSPGVAGSQRGQGTSVISPLSKPKPTSVTYDHRAGG